MMTAPTIVGLGEILWDVYPDVAHFGGAPANFSCHAASLGAEAWVVSAVGKDDDGRRARQILAERGVRGEGIAVDTQHPTGRVEVKLDLKGQATYVFQADTAWDFLSWNESLEALASRCDAVCFGSLGQRSVTARETIRRFVGLVPPEAMRVFDVNLRQQFYDEEVLRASLHLANVAKLNDEELPIVARLCGLPGGSEIEMMQALAKQFDVRLVALTRGARGALLLAQGEVSECQPPPTQVVDTVGAGDAFTAAVILGLLHGWPLAEINERACAVAAYVCTQRGATPPLPEELRAPFKPREES